VFPSPDGAILGPDNLYHRHFQPVLAKAGAAEDQTRSQTFIRLLADPERRLDLIGGGGWTRTNDLRIMSRSTGADSKELQQDSSVDSGKVLQNPHHKRTKTEHKGKE